MHEAYIVCYYQKVSCMKPLVYAPNRKIHAAAAATRNWSKVGPSGFRFLVTTVGVTLETCTGSARPA